MKTIEEYKEWVRDTLTKDFHISPSILVLRSFYLMEVEKPQGCTVRSFDLLRSIAESEKQLFKLI